MDKYVTLLGAEQVQSAASRMSNAADSMQRAADIISEALRQHQQFLDNWLMTLMNALEQKK
jgi:hypothetical protein